jgi:hypothetical protein
MLRVTIELLPLGDETRKRTLGTIDIANDGTGTFERGNYMVRLGKFGGRGVWRRGAVTQFPRRSMGPYDLLLRALVATVGDRNRRFVEQVAEELEPAECP